jgi:hypothetical protein
MLTIALTVATALGHGVARLTVTVLMSALLAVALAVGAIVLLSVLDVAFSAIDVAHGSAARMVTLASGGPISGGE